MYFFYIDESGTRDPKTSTLRADGTSVALEHLYVLTAVSLYERKWRVFEDNIARQKALLCSRILRDTSVSLSPVDCEVKSTWIRLEKVRQSQSRFLTELTEVERTQLAELFYSQLDPCHMKVFSVVIDKRKLRGDHITCDWLHQKAYELLLERIENYLGEYNPKHQGLIVMDDTDKSINRSLSMKSATLQKNGNRQVSFRHIVEHPFFTESKLSNGVQLADLCGYNIYRAFRNKDLEYSFFQRLLPYIYTSNTTAKEKLDGLKVWPDDSELIRFFRDGCRTIKNKPSL